MLNFYDILKSLYTKEKVSNLEELDIGLCLGLTKWLSQDSSNLPILQEVYPFVYYLKPINYYYVLYLSLPKKYKIPYFTKLPKETEPKDNKLLKEVQRILNYSDREMEFHSKLFEHLILKNDKYWRKELGL